MAALELISEKEFENAILHGVSLVNFNAYWCNACRAQLPVLDSLDDAYGRDVTIATMNIDENQRIGMDLCIHSIPTTIVFKEGAELRRFVGFQEAETLDQALSQALAWQQQIKRH